uniref:MOSC domain-containing protein n=1 Tax=Caenorhabditis tropicalis TaxID=1561998 RepID=A0A1I7U1K5_9PELO
MLDFDQDKKVLIGCLASSFLAYHTARQLFAYIHSNSKEWIPIGTVKNLHIYPIKSCKPIDLFAFKCTKLGPVMGELEDRAFVLVDMETGKFVTGRTQPKLVKMECTMEDGMLKVTVPDKPMVTVDLGEVHNYAIFCENRWLLDLKQDGFDCGDEVAALLSNFLEEPNYRLIFYKEGEGLYTERTCEPTDDWWDKNPVPKRKDDSQFTNLAPFLICTSASMRDLNEKMDKKISIYQFRPSIEVEGCPAWDEDKWAEIRIGDAHLQTMAACPRCVMTTVDPETAEKSGENQPLKAMRGFRVAPEGSMRKMYLDNPIFGVYAGLVKGAYIHVGQTVWVKYKPCAF